MPSFVRRRVLGAMMGAAALASLTAGAASIGDAGARRRFVLLHGSTHGPGGMAPLADALNRLGYAAACPELPFEDPDASPASVLEALMAQWAAIGGDGPISCVGHSISGLVLPLLHGAPRVDSLVYLAAVIPEPGIGFREQFQTDASMFCPDWVEQGHRANEDDTVSQHFLYHDVGPALRRLARRDRITFAAKGLWLQPVVAERHPDIHTVCLACESDRIMRPSWMHRAADELLGVQASSLPFGHMPHLADPMAVAKALIGTRPVGQPVPVVA